MHKAVWKDTVWTPGAIVDQIYFARYDKQGRISVENLLNPDGSAKTKLIFVYDKNNRIREEITVSVKQQGIQRIYRYSYDEQGRVDGKTVLDADRNIVLKDTIIMMNMAIGRQRVKFINDVPVLYEEREYVYYK